MTRLAWSVCAASVAMLLAGWGFVVAGDGVTPAADLVVTVALVTFPVVGALVASRHPRNAIGWLFCGAGALFAASALTDGYAGYALDAGRSGGVTAAWLSAWLLMPPLFGTPPLLFLLFPGGRPLAPRWRWAVRLTVIAIALQTLGTALLPGELLDAPVGGLENPAAVAGGDVIEGVGWAFGLVGLALATASLVLRFRRARGDERLQLEWFVSAAVLFALSCVIASVVWALSGGLTAGGELVILVAYATIPVAAGIAILRHRLYDIDVVINRALVYGALTATLGGAYLGLVLLAGLAVGRSSDLAIAVSTLAVAALFRPTRARIQGLVDRRFYRRRYDAGRTLEAFGGRLRDELDLEALGTDLRDVVRDTVQPAHVSLWLREAGR